MSLSTVLLSIFVLLIYLAITYYIGYNGWVWIRPGILKRFKWVYVGFIIIFSASMFLGRVFSWLPLELMGSFWIVIVGYSLILLPLANILVYFLKGKGIFWIGLGIMAFYLFVFIYGSFNAWNPVVRSYDIEVEKQAQQQELKVLMVSDLHLGPIVGEKHLERLVAIVDNEKPDIVLIPGDIIENSIEPFIKNDMGKILAKVSAPLGVYAVPGNHDYYGDDLLKMAAEVEKSGVRLLMDETSMVQNSFYLVGRNDKTDPQRAEVSELVEGLDQTKPLIMLDHQPFELEVAEENGIDVVLSGHTHRGQLAPANLITSMIFENDWGYLQKGSLHSFVSSGFGTWGPPLRVGSRSEVMVININFDS
ncbi:metallophosphoesterase [Mesobacillus harenae]|uniref:metallophosphoesterase n=1 Tax=Mesobacillus harenae TaxID=2213203 RepID=UPI001580E1F6|nr:metallophosphoesterase [Mesobacillus harenae]